MPRPRCFNGSYDPSIGEEGDNDNNAVSFHSPPAIDEVQRWKEFRRRQRTQPAATTDEEEVTDDDDVGYYPGAGVVPSSLVHDETKSKAGSTYVPRSEISASDNSNVRTEIMANTARRAVDLSRKEAYKLLEGRAGNDDNNKQTATTASSSLSAEKAKRVMQYAATPSPRVTHTKNNIIPTTTTTLTAENDAKKGKKIEVVADEETNYDDTISPKLSEVENFMVQLRRVRNESKTTPPKSVGDVQNTKAAIIATIANTTTTTTTTTAGNPEDEDDECTILSKQRKEQSRQRKSEDFQRRKNEFDIRIRDMKKDAAVDVADDELIVADGGIKKMKKVDLDDSTLDNDDDEEEEEEEKDAIRTKAVVDVGVGALWSGGSANHWLPTPSSLKKTETKEKKLNIALNEDDFSFKPSSIVNVNTTTTSTSNKHGGGGLSMKSIAISPIVTGAATGVVGGGVGHHTMTSSGRFNFARCSSLSNEKASSRGMTILTTMVNAANCTTQMGVLSPSSDLGDNDIIFAPSTATTLPIHFESTPKNNISESPNGGPVTTSESSFPSSTSATSPDISEGDKGGGGFGSSTTSNNAFRGLRVHSDKSIITTTSSKLVELGQKNDSQDPPLDDEEDESTNNDDGSNSLLGVTVVGSKKKRKKRKTKSPLFETVEEHDSLSSTLDNNADSENLASTDERDGKPTNGCIVRKQLDPDGFDWKELAKWTNVELTSKVSTVAAQDRKDQTLLGLSVDTIPEESDNEEFATVMDRVKTCLTPRMPNDTSIFTPKSIQSDMPRYEGGKKLSSIHELKSRFDSLGVVQNQSTKRSEEKSRFEFSSSTGSSESIKDSWTRSTASLASATDAEVVRPIPDEQDFNYTLSNSSETLSVKELRSKWETRNKATRPMVVRDACLNNRDIQATSTSESSVNDDTIGDETVDTKKVLRFVKSLEQKGSFDSIKSLDNENGGIEHKDTSNSSKENHYDKETVDAITDSITTYRGMPPKMRKEVVLVRTNAQAHEQLLKNKTEMKEDNNCAASNSNALSSNGNHAISSAAVPSNAEIVTALVKDRVAIFSTAKAALTRRRSSPSNVLPPQEANSDIPSIPLQQQSKISAIRGPSRVPLPAYQQVATPPRTIAMNQKSNSPSPLQVTNTNDSPNLQGPTNQRASSNFRQEFSRLPCSRYSSHADRPLRHVSTRNEEINRPVPVDTRYDSSPAQEFDYDDEDGITLSPTFSEVSGLTAPTCIGTINSQTSTHPDLFDKSHGNKNSYHETMSPIARHRQQQEKLALITGHTKLSTHPYIKRLSAKLRTMPVENQISNNDIILEEVATPKARGRPSDDQLQISPSRREQLISRVRASPRNLIPKSNPPITEERSLTKCHEWKERNVIVENNVKTFIRQKNGKGRFSESIKVNRRI